MSFFQSYHPTPMMPRPIQDEEHYQVKEKKFSCILTHDHVTILTLNIHMYNVSWHTPCFLHRNRKT